MAYMQVLDYVDVGTGGEHDATSWQFAKDKDFTKIIDESLKDTVNIKKWHSMLPKLPEDGIGYYKDLDMLYGRFKIHVGDYESQWFEVDPKSQNYQKVVITETGKDDIHTDSDAIGMQ